MPGFIKFGQVVLGGEVILMKKFTDGRTYEVRRTSWQNNSSPCALKWERTGCNKTKKGNVHNECTANWLYIRGQGRERVETHKSHIPSASTTNQNKRTSTKDKQ